MAEVVYLRPFFFLIVFFITLDVVGQPLTFVSVEPQPLGANVTRVIKSLQYLGHPLSDSLQKELEDAIEAEDSIAIQRLLDELVVA